MHVFVYIRYNICTSVYVIIQCSSTYILGIYINNMNIKHKMYHKDMRRLYIYIKLVQVDRKNM